MDATLWSEVLKKTFGRRVRPGEIMSTLTVKLKSFTFLLLFFNFLAGLNGESAQESISAVIGTARQSVVNLVTHRLHERDDPISGVVEQMFSDVPSVANTGSGVIVSSDGYILTNWHLTEGAVRIKVTHEGKEFAAMLIGEDPQTDLALVKVDGENLPAIKFADPPEPQVGDFVFSIGNPFGLGQTVSMGIVSATRRGEGEFANYIQTDAGIHPGSSGGALVNTKGELIGINCAFLWSEISGNQRIGFALPSSTAANIFEQLRKHGFVMRSWLGVELQDVTPLIARAFSFNQPNGVLVSDFTPRSPADVAGLQRGDIVVELNQIPVRDAHSMNLQIAQTKAGTRAEIKIFRKGVPKILFATLQRSPGIHVNDAEPVERLFPMDGVEVEELTSDIRAALSLPKSLTGVIITFISKDSTAFTSGLMTADIIQEVNHIKIASRSQFEKAIDPAKQKENIILLLVYRDEHTRYVVLD
jgi:serine protease Do